MLSRFAQVLLLLWCAVLATPALAAGDPNDEEGSKDPALFSRMSGFYISNYDALAKSPRCPSTSSG